MRLSQAACGWDVVQSFFTQQWNYVSFVSKKEKEKEKMHCKVDRAQGGNYVIISLDLLDCYPLIIMQGLEMLCCNEWIDIKRRGFKSFKKI